MISIGRIALLVLLVWVFIYTLSFGTWTWKRKNKLGAIMIYLVAICSLALPIYSVFFRE